MKTFFELFNLIKRDFRQENFLALLQNGNIATKLSFSQFLENIESLASFFIASNLQKNEKVVLMMDSSPHWLVCDLATIKAGGVCVPMFANLSDENLSFQLENCEASFICLQNEEVFSRIKKIGYKFKKIITLEPFSPEFLGRNKEYGIVNIEDAITQGFANLLTQGQSFKLLKKVPEKMMLLQLFIQVVLRVGQKVWN